jgi:D-glycerate 3-kinase
VWRGLLGSREIYLGLELLPQIRPTILAFIPQFDKSLQNGAGDRTTPLEIQVADII